MSPLTSPPSPCSPVSSCGFHVCTLHPSSSLFTHADMRRSLPCPTVHQRCPIKKGWTPLIWRSLIILCRTGGPLIQPLPRGLTRQATAYCPPPLSPIVLSSFSGCNCSTINRGGKENGVCACIGVGQGGRKWIETKEMSREDNV